MTALPLSHEPPAPAAQPAEAGIAVAAGHGRLAIVAETAAAGALALLARIPGLAHEPWGDELYHILAARQYVETGVPGINGGWYPRSFAYTEMVAGLYQVFGVSPVVARLPALAAAVLTIVVLFAWLRASGERLAAWTAAVLLIFTPDLIEQAQYARFYPLQHLFLLLGAVALAGGVVAAERAQTRRVVILAAASLLAVAAATYFQTLTIIGAAGLAAAALLLVGPRLAAAMPRRRLLLLVAGAAGLVAAGALAAHQLEITRRVLALATYTDLWAEGTRNEVRFYHWLLLRDYPTAWTLFPLLGLLALDRRPRIATIALAVFVVGFAAHTLLAWKAARYISYTLPFFAIVVGLGLAHAVPWVRAALDRVIPAAWPARPLLRAGAWCAIAGFLLLTNGVFIDALKRITRDHSVLHPGGPTPTLSWALAEPVLEPLALEADAVVSTEDLEAVWFLDRLDYVLDRDHLLQGRAKPEFTVDERIMARMIGGTEALRRVVACHPTGLLVAMRWAMQSYKMTPETAAFIRETLKPVPLPERTGLVAFTWDDEIRAGAGPCLEPLAEGEVP